MALAVLLPLKPHQSTDQATPDRPAQLFCTDEPERSPQFQVPPTSTRTAVLPPPSGVMVPCASGSGLAALANADAAKAARATVAPAVPRPPRITRRVHVPRSAASSLLWSP